MRCVTFALGLPGVLTLAVIGAFAAGCGGDTGGATAPAPAPADLDGRTFVAHAGNGNDLVGDTTLVLTFTPGALHATAGCNTLRAPYAIADRTLRWTADPASTTMACGPERDAQDRHLTQLLTDGATVGLADEELTLSRGDVTFTLTEGADPSAPPRLRGTTWKLLKATDPEDQVIDVGPGGVDAVAGVEAPTLRIGADDVAAVFTGCNRGSAPVQVGDDGFLTFGPLALTRMACDGTAAELETAMTAVLNGRAAFGFGDPPLSISKDGYRLDFAPGS